MFAFRGFHERVEGDAKKMSMTQTRILVVDDHAVVREGVRATLATDPTLIIVGEAVDGDDACVQGAAQRTMLPHLLRAIQVVIKVVPHAMYRGWLS